MPGLSQLKQFEKDILTLGDEPSLRASRGEKPVIVPIPKGITVDNDSDDFVLGMPEKPLEKKETTVDEDLSDISGTSSKTQNEVESQDSAAPDLSSLLSPVISNDSDGVEMEMPDLSMFMDEPAQEVQEEIPQEPVEISVADMSLDALLAGAGFDGSEGSLNSSDDEEKLPDFNSYEMTEIDPDDFFTDSKTLEAAPKTPKKDNPSDFNDIPLNNLPELDFLYNPPKVEDPVTESPSDSSLSENGDALDLDQLDLGDLGFDVSQDFSSAETPTPASDSASTSVDVDISDFDSPDFNADDFSVPDFNSDDLGGNDFSSEDFSNDEFSMDDIGTDNFATDDFATDSSTDDFSVPDFNIGDFDTNESASTEEFSSTGAEISDFDVPDFQMPSAGNENDIGELEDLGSLDNFDFNDDNSQNNLSGDGNSEDFNSTPAGLFDFNDLDFSTDENNNDDFSSNLDLIDNDIPDYDDGFESSNEGGEDTVEVFDTTGMEDIDFGIPDTDSSLEGSEDLDSDNDDFSFDTDFEIPGFSDVEVIKEQKSAPIKNKNLDIPDFSKGIPGKELPQNTLSDEQYKVFLQNFSEYPLNVRLAFEDLIVQNEFTEDAEFEIVEKILHKAPARQVAAMLEKMLDTSIPVPRDYEHRTAEEYAAYKKSIQYQLRNKIIPAFLIGCLVFLVSFGLFHFTKNCIYIPAKASKYYKQGYTLLQADEYSQAQMKFDQAASYKMKKKWFYNFARGYREHKQYYRAADIYQKTLYYFDHDKQAGLEYAEMQLYDLSNYPSAEEIVRRQILDYHVNDPDGILLLGDIMLEWGTEKDPTKLEEAKEQYLKLMQLYKPNDLYNARMMRYYIRSDNLQQVINYQHMFEENEKGLAAEDWTELGGYLLEKMYGPLSPSDEALRYQIEGLRKILQKAVTMDPENPTALYNLANYYINTNEIRYVASTLNNAIDKFNKSKQLNKREIYRFIDAYRLLGENYIKTNDYLQAQEQYTAGITLYTTEKEIADFEGTPKIGKLYADLADINYLLAGDYENAAINYRNSVDLGNDNPSIRYRMGYMSYKKKNYQEALGAFMKAGEGNSKEKNLLYSMGNTLILRNDDYAAEGYFDQLMTVLDLEVQHAGGSLFPQTNRDQFDLVETYMQAANNYGVVLHNIAKRTGNSQKNAQAIVQFQQSLRAWDSITRNQTTMTRLEGSNLAEQNIKYVTHPRADYEPSIYLDIPKTLTDSEKL